MFGKDITVSRKGVPAREETRQNVFRPAVDIFETE